MFNPQPKPTKKEPEKMTASEFRKKYGSKTIKVKSKRKSKKFLTPQKRFYSSSAWKWFRRFILTQLCDPYNLTVPNYTGVEMLPIKGKQTHLGHYVKVFEGNNTHMNTAFNERNVLTQSLQDNRYKGGKMDVMAVQIDLMHGQGTTAELVRISKHFKKYSDADFKQIAEKYKQKTYDLIKEKDIGKWWNN